MGYVFIYPKGQLIIRTSKLQFIVVLSTMEAEYIPVSMTKKETTLKKLASKKCNPAEAIYGINWGLQSHVPLY